MEGCAGTCGAFRLQRAWLAHYLSPVETTGHGTVNALWCYGSLLAAAALPLREYRRHHGDPARRTLDLLAELPPLPCGEHLSTLAEEHFRETGNAVEIGVYRGGFAKWNLQHWTGRYYAVDAWAYRPNDGNDKNFRDQATNHANYDLALNATAPWRDRATLVKGLSQEVATTFANDTFDWIYVDALHTHNAVLSDLRAWWPKLRPGGLLSGDDYGDEAATPFLTPEAQAEVYPCGDGRGKGKGSIGCGTRFHWGVVRATQAFAKEVGSPLFVSWLKGKGMVLDPVPTCYSFPAWYIVKPFE